VSESQQSVERELTRAILKHSSTIEIYLNKMSQLKQGRSHEAGLHAEGPKAEQGRDDKPKEGGFTAVIAETFLTDTSSTEWFVDTGATEHMSYDWGSSVRSENLSRRDQFGSRMTRSFTVLASVTCPLYPLFRMERGDASPCVTRYTFGTSARNCSRSARSRTLEMKALMTNPPSR